MAQQESTRAPRRVREHQRNEVARQLQRHRRWQRGQTLIIFALSLTVLLGFAGLAIDVMRVFDLYAREERAAEAGALAGVLYMPTFYDTASVAPADGNSAVSRAMLEVVKNGFGTTPAGAVVANACPANPATVTVAVCRVSLGGGSYKQTDLQVVVTQNTPIFLLSAVGIQSATISATAQAEYLPQVQMGSRLNYFGDGTYNLQDFRAVTNGQGDLAQFGDPYVNCQQGPDTAPPADGANYTDSVGVNTNHQEFGTPLCGPNKGPQDIQPFGYSGPATSSSSNPGAHNYAINVASADIGATVYVWNGNFVPDDIGGTTFNQSDHFNGAPGQTTYGSQTINGHYDDPALEESMTYTLYQVPYLYLRSGDVRVASTVFQPYDMLQADLRVHDCRTDGTQAYDLRGTSTYAGAPSTNPANCVSVATTCFQRWCPVGTVTSAGLFRLAVETTSMSGALVGGGSHQYSLEICKIGSLPSGSGPCAANAGTTLAAWNNMTVFYGVSGSTATFDLGQIPAAYAGRQINIGIFDPGDASGNVYMQIIPPAGSGVTVSVPQGIRTPPSGPYVNMIQASIGGDAIYNGRWINTLVTLPPNYSGGSGWWQLTYITSSSTSDTVTVSFSLVGAPVHLVPLG